MASVFYIPADQPFLPTLVRGLLAWPGDELASTLLLLPSRRACHLARDLFAQLGDGQVRLLPRLRPVGEPDEDELLLAPDLAPELPDAIHPHHRQLLLTRLILAARNPSDGSEIPHEQALRLAGELARLLDELLTEEVPIERLRDLVPDELARHWQVTLDFLRVLEDAWPRLLAELGLMEPPERRNRLLDGLARRWRDQPPAHPVVIAGTTGSIPAVARLTATVAATPHGTVVLPGLDPALDDPSWEGLRPTHPQWMLRRLLELLHLHRAAVPLWPASAPLSRSGPRTRESLWREVMRPAVTAGRGLADLLLPSGALRGLSLEAHPDLASEALALALRIRGALEDPTRRVALVTPDRTLARRVAVELRRWGIFADDSAGVPLDQSPPGSFLLLLAHCVVEDAAPVPLLSALKHPLAQGGLDGGTFRRYVRALERGLLRGPRPQGGFSGLLATLRAAVAGHSAATEEDDRHPNDRRWSAPVPPGELLAWLEQLATAAEPFRTLCARREAPLRELVACHRAFASWLASDAAGDPKELWAREAGRAAEEFWVGLEAAAPTVDRVPVSAYPALLAILMSTVQVRSNRALHGRVAILGQLESRLVTADLVLLGGLSEGTWPAPIEPGPWLNRRMREALGLPPVEQAIGIAAFDLTLQAMAPEVVLTWSRKDGNGTPRSASRWLQRLVAVSKAAGMEGELAADPCWRAWGLALDRPPSPPQPCDPPEPRPPFARPAARTHRHRCRAAPPQPVRALRQADPEAPQARGARRRSRRRRTRPDHP